MQNTNEISVNHTLKIGDETIKQVNTAKFLGIIIDDKLSWNAHIDYCKKNKIVQWIICNQYSKTYPFAKTFKISILHIDTSPLNIWTLTLGLYVQNTIKNYKLFKINPCKVLPNQNIMHPGPIYENLGILQISKPYQLEAAKLMFLNKNQHLPSPLQAIFTPITDIHNHNTRYK